MWLERRSAPQIFDLSSKRLYHRTIHTLARAKGCQRFSVPATAARDGEEAVLSSSTARNKWGLCASLDGRMSRSDQDPRGPMSRLASSLQIRAAHTTVPAQVLKKVGKRPSMPDPFVILDRQVFSGQLGEVWAPSKVPISLEDGHGRQRGAFSNASSASELR